MSDVVRMTSATSDGSKVALAGSYDVSICALQTCRLVPLQLEPGSSDSIGAMAFSPDGRLLIVGTGAGRLYFIDTKSALPLGVPVEAHRYFVEHLAFSHDGAVMASGGRDGSVVLWDLATQRSLGRMALPPAVGAQVTSCFVGVDGRLAVSYTDSGPVLLETNIQALESRACRLANRNLSVAEWGQFFGSGSCRGTCDGVSSCVSWLPRPPASQ